MTSDALPDGLLVAYYGDDYTGSAAVMEVLTFAGLPAVLFLDLPTPEEAARFAGYRGIGIAGIARSRAPAWMDRHLPPVFRALAGLGAPVSQYKVCSTFDSAPHVGSIGRAVDLGIPILGGDWTPLIVAAPGMERYQAFGNLFASVDGESYRIDRHPTMARHPVTPMDEGDIRRHLARQTARKVGLVDLVAMKAGRADAALARERARGCGIVALDVIDDETLAEAGRLVWEHRGAGLFAVGSQGIEYALVAHWRRRGLLPPPAALPRVAPVDRLVCVSGSCSPVTARQIAAAESAGFAGIAIDATAAVDPRRWEAERDRVRGLALAALGQGRDAVLFTARGPDDPAVAALDAALDAGNAGAIDAGAVNDRIGAGLGLLVGEIMAETGLRRAVIAGGDTSGHAASTLGISALTALAPIAPGAPLCHAHRRDGTGFEIVLKGGQGGAEDFFTAAKGIA
jgi:uncharacterized protein YgbK (DUF1537 family)